MVAVLPDDSPLKEYLDSCPRRSRFFVTVPYVMQPDGTLTPVRPLRGPCVAYDARPCRLVKSHVRPRSTGPAIPLHVLCCQVHGIAFTLYPPGHVPYGRGPAVRLGFDGGPVQPEADRDPTDLRVEGTIFEAARDAAQGKAWDRARDGGSARWWQTQRRHLAQAALWLGVLPGLAATTRERIAAALGVPLLLLREHAARVQRAPGYRSRGAAVMAVVGALPVGVAVDRLAEAGCVIGRWSAAARGDRHGVLRLSTSQHIAPRAPAAAPRGPSPAHESETLAS